MVRKYRLIGNRERFYKGQVLFLRAFYYSFLYRCYGDVPLILEPLDLETQYQPKVEATKILEQIYSDLDDAIGLLPDNTYLELPGRVTKVRLLALKVRIMLYDAYNDNGKADIGKMGNILTVAEQIKGYSLSNDFESIFQGAGQETNTEIIFSTKYLAPNNWHTSDLWFGAWLRCAPLTNLVSEFEFKDGTSFSTENPLYNPENPIENRDPRLDMSTFLSAIGYGRCRTACYGRFADRLRTEEICNPRQDAYPIGYNTRSDQDWVHFRYAEILLAIAEAENEVNGLSSESI